MEFGLWYQKIYTKKRVFKSSCTLPPVPVIWSKENGILILGVGLLTEHNNRVMMPTRWIMLVNSSLSSGLYKSEKKRSSFFTVMIPVMTFSWPDLGPPLG